MTLCLRNLIIGLLAIHTIISGILAKRTRRIIGGTDAIPGTFRFIVSLGHPQLSTEHYCGGAIISPRHILTAAHCLDAYPMDEFAVRSGAHNLNDPNIIVSKIKSLFLHPKYVQWISGRQNLQNDIGIILLEEDLIFGRHLSSINLPMEEPIYGQFCDVAGWGANTANQTQTQITTDVRSQQSILQVVSGMRLLTDQECLMKALGPEGPQKLCAYHDGAALCVGDSGSPLVFGGRIVGVTSASYCEVGSAHLYMNVYHYLSWINSVINWTSRH